MVKPIYCLVDIRGNIVKHGSFDYIVRLKDILTAPVFDVSEADEIYFGEDLQLEFTGKLRIINVTDRSVLKVGNYYALHNFDTNDVTVGYYYNNPDSLDENGTEGFGFNTADGNSFLPIYDLKEDTGIIPLTFLLNVPIINDLSNDDPRTKI